MQENFMDYKVCILAAGIGSRMLEFTKTFNKVLLPIQGKPVICHIIEKFPENIGIIIAVGYKKEGVIDYLKTAYPNRKFNFVNVGKYEGVGTGPGYSLLKCKEYLQCPFIQFAGDTLVREEIPFPNKNWFGVADVKNTERFCSVKIMGDKIIRIDDKIKNDNKHAFIGLAGIKDYDIFWSALEKDKKFIAEELQVSNGFRELINKDLHSKRFTWFDTGTWEAYDYTIKNYPDGESYS